MQKLFSVVYDGFSSFGPAKLRRAWSLCLVRPKYLNNFSSTCAILRNSWLFGRPSPWSPAVHLFEVKFFSLMNRMDSNVLLPPRHLNGMKVLDKEAFKKSVTVLSANIELDKMSQLMNDLKKYMLKCVKLKSVQDTDNNNIKKVLFNPNLVKKFSDFDSSTHEAFKASYIKEDMFTETEINLCYDNWSADDIFKAILPENESLSSYSTIGHVIHVNLKPNLLDYKSIIGQVLLDKITFAKSVVNKTMGIDNVYRNFEMELIAGEPDYDVTVKENGCSFQFNFATVYWNPRLGMEHSRVIDFLKFGDILIDVFCGVGPFAIPAAKKKCMVFANDLNPESFRWLNNNIKLNKIKSDYIQTFNKDGSDFIKQDVKDCLLQAWKNEFFIGKIVIVMNLPALALDFLKCFKGLLKPSDLDELNAEFVQNHLPIVHCYFFALSSETTDNMKAMIERRSCIDLNKVCNLTINFVRNVSTTKDMFKTKFELPLEHLICRDNKELDCNSGSSLFEEPKAKKLCKSD